MTMNGCVRRPCGVCKSAFVKAGALVVFLLLGSIAARAQQLTQLWANRVDGPAHSNDQLNAIVADSSDNSYVTGSVCVTTTSSSGCNGSTAILTIKYDKAGNVVWQNQTAAGGSNASGAAIAVDSAGNVYVTGNAGGSIVTIKYSPTGQQVWLETVTLSSGTFSASAAKIAVDSGGNSYIAIGGQFATASGAAAIKYDPNGNLLWKTGSTTVDHVMPSGVAIDAQGSLYIVGETDNNSAFSDCCGGFTEKLDTNGNLLWSDNSTSPIVYSTNGIVLDSAGNAYVTGIASNGLPNPQQEFEGHVQEFVKKYDPAGNQIWVALYQTPRGATNWPSAIALDASGNVYTAGRSVAPANSSGNDYSTVKFDTTGKALWEALYNGTGSGNDIAVGLALDSFANVYVTGQSTSTGGATGQDYATVEYDTNGNQLSVARYNGPQNLNDIPVGIAFGSTIAFVAGTSPLDFHNDNLWDWATVAYAPSGASPVLLSSVSVSPSSVTGGMSSTGTVTLNSAAPPGGATVSLTNNNPSVVHMPSSVSVSFGQTIATFTVTASSVTAVTSVTIAGSYYATQSTTLAVNPFSGGGNPIIFVQQATSTYGGGTANVNLAPYAGDALVLFSDNDRVGISSVTGGGVTWVRGSSSGTHSVGEVWYGLNSSGSNIVEPIIVTYANSTGSGGINVSEFSGVAATNALDVAGSVSGISPDPATPTAVTTDANDLILAAAADVNTSPTSGPNQSFTALTEATGIDGKIIPAYLITAATGSYSTSWAEGNGGWDAIIVALKAASTSTTLSVSSLSLSPSSVTGGSSSTGTVTLNGPAPSTGATVMLASSNTTAAQVPSNVTVPAGTSSTTFPVTTSALATTTPVTISATYNGTQTATLTVNPSGGGGGSMAFVQQATANFSSNSTVTVTLNSNPIVGDALILFSDNDSFGISSVNGGGVTWVRGSSSGTHAVGEIWYGLNSSGANSFITVTYASASGSGAVNVSEFSGVATANALDIAPGANSGISTTPTTLAAVTNNANDLILAAAADINTAPTTGGPTNSFTALKEAASDEKIVPAYLIASATGSYTTSWTEGNDGWDAIIVALKSAGGSSGVSLSSVSLSPSSVTGGTSSTGTVTLSGPATGGGITVGPTSSNTSAAQVPSTVTVPSGSSSATFTVTTSTVMTATPVTITANFNGTQTATLTVTPSGGGGGPKALVQQATATYSTTNTVVVALNAPPQPGDVLVLFSSNDSVYISSVSGGGVTWVLGSASGQHSVAEIWYGLNTSGSGMSITVTYSGTGSGGANVSEFSGVSTANALDVAPGSTFGVSATPTTPTASTTNANDLILAAAADQSVAATAAGPTNGFAPLTEAADSSKIIPAYQIVSATGSYSTNWTETNDGWDAVIVALK